MQSFYPKEREANLNDIEWTQTSNLNGMHKELWISMAQGPKNTYYYGKCKVTWMKLKYISSN